MTDGVVSGTTRDEEITMTKEEYLENHSWQDEEDGEPCCEICGESFSDEDDVLILKDYSGEWLMCFRCANNRFGVRGVLELIEEQESWKIERYGKYIAEKGIY